MSYTYVYEPSVFALAHIVLRGLRVVARFERECDALLFIAAASDRSSPPMREALG